LNWQTLNIYYYCILNFGGSAERDGLNWQMLNICYYYTGHSCASNWWPSWCLDPQTHLVRSHHVTIRNWPAGMWRLSSLRK
jgi:hypothetical protein